jgi:hypothetical protein
MNISTSYEKQNKFNQSEIMNKECLAKSIVINGKDHPSTLRAMTNLATSYRNQENFDDAEKLYHFGLNIGVAFQIQDDYLDTFGTEAQVGKQIGGDIIQNKKTFLILKALSLGNTHQKQTLMDLFDPKNGISGQEKINKVTEILRELSIPQEAKLRKQYYFELAMKSLDEVQVLQEKKVQLVNKVKEVKKVKLVLKENKVRMDKMVLKVILVYRVNKDPLDYKVTQVILE